MATILVIEERPINRRFLVTLLQERGHRVLQAAEGAEGLDIAEAENPDVVIIEILARSMDACQFAATLEAKPGAVQPRLVFRGPVTIAPEAREVARGFGARFLVQPCNPEELLEVVGSALGEPKPQAEPAATR